MVQGVFAGRVEEQRHPPIYKSPDEIKVRLDEFFKDPYSSGDLSISTFLKSLTYMTKLGYRPPLHVLTNLKATAMYHDKLAELASLPVQTVRDILQAKTSS